MGLVSYGDSFVLAAVADGLGSASDSHRGAQLAVAHSLDYISWALEKQRLADVDLVAAIDAADRAIRAAGPRPEERASTLTVAVTSVEPYDWCHDFRVARIGDSPAFVLGEGEFRQVFDGGVTDMHDTRTACLPQRGGAVEVTDSRLEPGQALVLVTDGVGIPLTVPEVGAYLAECWAEPPGPVEFLHALQFRARSFDDDRSAVVIWAPKAAS
jgi:serine/threonine protein phosphatase PrpC